MLQKPNFLMYVSSRIYQYKKGIRKDIIQKGGKSVSRNTYEHCWIWHWKAFDMTDLDVGH